MRGLAIWPGKPAGGEVRASHASRTEEVFETSLGFLTRDRVVDVALQSNRDVFLELWLDQSGGAPIYRECVTDDLPGLAEEVYIRAVLAESIPRDSCLVRAEIGFDFSEPPFLSGLHAMLAVRANGVLQTHSERVGLDRWSRTASAACLALIAEGKVAKDSPVYRAMSAVPSQRPLVLLETPPIEQPAIVSRDVLGDCGVRQLGEGSLDPARPVLVNQRMLEDMLQRTEHAGQAETGGAVLGKMVRLQQPLPGTTSRIVTILAVALADGRHVGDHTSFRFSPDALAEAAQIAKIRNVGERVLTVWHSHGWGPNCSDCRKETCPLPAAHQVSPDDYTLLTSLFSSKATLLPIAGRSQGTQIGRPIVCIHHWLGGIVRPLRWQHYEE
jgi:hypothetical protein